MKRLLCIISCMNAGGAETFLMKLYRTLDTSKYQMDFCVNIKTEGLYDSEIKALGGKIFHIPSKSEDVNAFKKGLTEIVKKEGYEYVLRVTANGAGFFDLKTAKKAGARICTARSSNSSDGGGIKAVTAHRLGRLLFGKYVDVRLAPSDLAAKYTFGEKAYKDGHVTILHNAIDPDIVCYSSTGRDSVRHELNIPENITVVGHIGRFAKQKNHTFLLNIFNEYHKQNPESMLLLAGTGELEDSVRRQAAELKLTDSVIFAGVRTDIPDVLSAMDIFVFPSFYEGMPNTVIEAQATGLPCIIADTITREAAITGLVKYLGLDLSAAAWAEAIKNGLSRRRTDSMKEDIEKAGYDIHGVTKLFTSLVFDEQSNL